MKKISSSTTGFYKKGFPIFWFGFLSAIEIALFVVGGFDKEPVFAMFPVFMAVVGYIGMKYFLWKLVDEVYDDGDFLIVRNAGEEELIPISNVTEAIALENVSPPQIDVFLELPSRFGRKISFSPKTDFWGSLSSMRKVAEELTTRANAHRSNDAI